MRRVSGWWWAWVGALVWGAGSNADLIGFVPLICVALAHGAFLIRRRRMSVAGAPIAGGCCPHCGYDLRASPERCPECGTPRRIKQGHSG